MSGRSHACSPVSCGPDAQREELRMTGEMGRAGSPLLTTSHVVCVGHRVFDKTPTLSDSRSFSERESVSLSPCVKRTMHSGNNDAKNSRTSKSNEEICNDRCLQMHHIEGDFQQVRECNFVFTPDLSRTVLDRRCFHQIPPTTRRRYIYKTTCFQFSGKTTFLLAGKQLATYCAGRFMTSKKVKLTQKRLAGRK